MDGHPGRQGATGPKGVPGDYGDDGLAGLPGDVGLRFDCFI